MSGVTWKVDATNKTDDGVLIVSSGGQIVARVPYCDADARRDAELIAAAPDLLSAIQAAHAAIISQLNGSGTVVNWVSLLMKMQDAMEKAGNTAQ